MSDTLRIIPLGGLGEIGKNMTVFELGDERIVVDAGLAFPRDEHLGVDLILPDFGYLRDRPVRAVVLTHAHEDHVGGLPYLMREVRIGEIWATRLTLGLIKSKLDEHGLLRPDDLREIDPDGAPVDLGPFRLEFVRMSHSVPDAVGICIETSAGRVFHTGDWKLDHPAARRLDECGATRLHALGAGGRRGIPPDHSGEAGPDPDLELRLQHPPHAAGDRCRRRRRAQGRRGRPVDAAEHECGAEPRLRGDARRGARSPSRSCRCAPARAADPVHGLAGRAALGADARLFTSPATLVPRSCAR